MHLLHLDSSIEVVKIVISQDLPLVLSYVVALPS